MKIKFLFIFSILFLSGCSNEKYIECSINNNNFDYTLSAVYKIYYEDLYVTRIEKSEEYISKNPEILEYFYEYKNLEYEKLNKLYNGYQYDVKLYEKNVKLKSIINLKRVNIKKMLLDDYLDNDYVISNRLTLSGLKEIYISKGAICN